MRAAAASAPDLLEPLCTAALGRAAQPPERVPALHALASCVGAEALGASGAQEAALLNAEVWRMSNSSASRQCMRTHCAAHHGAQPEMVTDMPQVHAYGIMSALACVSRMCQAELFVFYVSNVPAAVQAEEHIREKVYSEAFPDREPARGPAQRMLELLQRPFVEVQVAACRALAPLCCRRWFAADVCLHGELLAFLLDAKQGTGTIRKWCFAVVLELERIAGQAAARIEQGNQDAGADAALAQHHTKLADAVAAGMYGELKARAFEGEAVPEVAVADATA